MTSPQTGRPSHAPHRVADISFGQLRLTCECFEVVAAPAEVPPWQTPEEALVEAWLEHRRSVGALRAKFRGDVLEAM